MNIHAKTFKYQIEFERLVLQDCPPRHYRELKMPGYRFVHQDLLHQNNFSPVAIINPARVNSLKDSVSRCESFGLSLFEDEAQAKAKFQEMMAKTRDTFANLVGDHLAALDLEPTDGVGSSPNFDNFTHFTFHEYAHADLVIKISGVEKI